MLSPARLIFFLLSHTPMATKATMAKEKARNNSQAVFGHLPHQNPNQNPHQNK